ncbi:MAG: hypothetical protein Q8P20_05310 [bacterium]|nr:hypothetical protein [bacterium]
MRKYLIITILFISLVAVILPLSVFAEGEFDRQFRTFAQSAGAGTETPQDPRVVVAQLVKAMLGFVGIAFFAYSVYAGYLILSSAGDEDKIKKGKSTLRTGIIGIFVAVSAYSILTLVSSTALRSLDSRPPAFDYGGDIGIREYDGCRAAGGTVESCSKGY